MTRGNDLHDYNQHIDHAVIAEDSKLPRNLRGLYTMARPDIRPQIGFNLPVFTNPFAYGAI